MRLTNELGDRNDEENDNQDPGRGQETDVGVLLGEQVESSDVDQGVS